MKTTARRQPLLGLLYGGLLALLLIMPLHAFLSTWLGTSLGQRSLWQAWKEILLIGMSGAALWLLLRDRALRKFIISYLPNQLIGLYGLLHLALLLLAKPPLSAALFGLKTNLAFLLLFMLAQIVGFYRNPKQLERRLSAIIIGGGVMVGIFGLLQVTVLPDDWLRHFGYGPATIQPFLTINDEGGFVRILSTLGGPNQLGQFLILPLAIVLHKLLERWRGWYLLAALPMLISLYFSYGRAAYIGLVVALAVIVLRRLSPQQLLITTLAGLLLLGAGGLLVSVNQNNRYIRRVILHTNDTPGFEHDSDSARLRALRDSATAVIKQPLGYGPGSAGPAAFHQTAGPARIGENYYLQLATEVGLIGLAIFIGISILVAINLWQRGAQVGLATPLLATLAAVSVINLFLHGWTDSTIALIWWGAAGAIIRKRI